MYEEPPPKRRRWAPWLLVALLLAAAGIAGWYVFTQIQDQLAASKPVAVPGVVGLRELNAKAKIEEAGLEAESRARREHRGRQGHRHRPVARRRNTHPEGRPGHHHRLDRGAENHGPGRGRDGLRRRRRRLERGEPGGAQARGLLERSLTARSWPRTRRRERSSTKAPTVILRVSKGEQVATCPTSSIRPGERPCGAPGGRLRGANRSEAPSDSTPEGLVSAQTPDPGTEAAKGSTVTITVSTGPSTATVPNVVGQQSGSRRGRPPERRASR